MTRPSADAPRLLLLARGYPPELGGIETYSHEVATAYGRRGFAVTVLTAHPGPKGTEEHGPVTVVNVGVGPQVLVFLRMLWQIARMRRSSITMVHATTWRVALPALLWRLPPPLLSVHGREVLVVPRPLRPIMRWVNNRCLGVIAVSPTTLDALRSVLPALPPKAAVAWNGISVTPRPDNRREGGTPHIFTVCRLAERKNLVHAVRAVADVIAGGQQVTFSIAGTGPEQDAIEAEIAARRVADHVRMLGFVDDADLEGEYLKADIFLHPQIASMDGQDVEGFGIAIADAMALGCAVVVGKDGGPADYVVDGETGRIVDGRDVAAIAGAVSDLVGDRAMRQRIASAGQKFAATELTWDSHVDVAIQLTGWHPGDPEPQDT